MGFPTTKLSKVYLGSKEAPGRSVEPVLVFLASGLIDDFLVEIYD
ncbi:hypothetical protein OAT81_04795 [Amylibacter sp.]|nr:hypothetical protein [Amylibacter sp.]